jgi:hypothetical protein
LKKGRRFWGILIIYVILLLLIVFATPKAVNWTPTFSGEDKIPYSAYILYHQLGELFPSGGVKKNDASFFTFYYHDFGKGNTHKANFIILTNSFSAGSADINALCNFVADGNTVFISSQNLPELLLDTLGLKLTYKPSHLIPFDKTDTTYSLNFTDQRLERTGGYEYSKAFWSMDISADTSNDNIDSTSANKNKPDFEVLGKDEFGQVNFVKARFGRGNFFLQTYPMAFTNYFMLQNDNGGYVSGCLSYLPDRSTYWDEHYKPTHHGKAQTPLRFILSVPGYKWAYFLAIFSVVFYVIFSAKRQQRAIPVIEPVKNLSLDFVRTIGTLYYNQKDYKDLAGKKMIYFLEKVRNVYFLPTQVTDELFQRKLVSKSNASPETVHEIFNIYTREVINAAVVGEQTLINFNKALERFYYESGLNNK